MAKLYNFELKNSRVSGTTDHAPLTSYMHHFISGTKIPHSLLNAQQITSPLHMPIKHYITSFGVCFVLYLFQRESFFLVFHHPYFSLYQPLSSASWFCLLCFTFLLTSCFSCQYTLWICFLLELIKIQQENLWQWIGKLNWCTTCHDFTSLNIWFGLNIWLV